MLISLGVPPKEVTMLQLPTSPQSQIIGIEAIITERSVSVMNKKSFPCKEYSIEELDFTTCSQNFYASFLKDKINCTIAGER